MKLALAGFAIAVAVASLLVGVPVRAQTEADGSRSASRRSIVEQKAQLVQRILADSPASQRIEGSDNVEAKRFLIEAREHYAQGVKLFASGDVAGSESAFNDAMWMIGKARQLVPDSMRRVVEHRTRYEQLTGSVEAMLGASQRHLARTPAGKASAAGAEIERAIRMVDEARALAGAERFEDANRNLLGAERALVAGLRLALGNATLDYTARFDTPAEELNFEIERFVALQQLVPLALAELKPSREAAQLVDRYVGRGLSLREAAAREAGRRDWQAALKSVREASDWLQRALLAAGLVTPQQ